MRSILVHFVGSLYGRSDVRDCSEQYERIVFRNEEPSPLPEGSRLQVDSIDHECAAANELRRGDTAHKGVFDQSCADTAACPGDVGRELAQ